VTIPKEQRTSFGLHENADYFAFIYPVQGLGATLSEDQKDKLDNDTTPALLLGGGFVYVNKQGIIQDVRAITDSGPTEMTWAPACELGEEAQRKLREQKRFRKVTRSELHKQGVRSFAWINPGEFEGQLGATPSPLGAFAYAASDDGTSMGVYFALSLGASKPLREKVDELVAEASPKSDGAKRKEKRLEAEKDGGRTARKQGTLGDFDQLHRDKAKLLALECIEKGECEGMLKVRG